MNKNQKKKKIQKAKKHQAEQKIKPKGVIINVPAAHSKGKGGF